MTEQSLIPIYVKNKPKQIGVPLRFSMPFSLGQVNDLRQLDIYCGNYHVQFFAETLSSWPDGSVKWVLLGFLSKQECENFYLTITPKEAKNALHDDAVGISTEIKNDILSVLIPHFNTQKISYKIALEQTILSAQYGTNLNESELATKFYIYGKENQLYESKKIQHKIHSYYCPHSKICLALEIEIDGLFECKNGSVGPNFKHNMVFHLNSPYIKYHLQLHNPKAAKHLNGQWDLGDDGAFVLNGLKIQISPKEQNSVILNTNLTIPANNERFDANNGMLKLTQYSSGGIQWQSPVHVANDNKVHLPFNGFSLSQNGNIIQKGKRSSPQLTIQAGEQHIAYIASDQFWQCFPATLEINNNKVELTLLSVNDGYKQELQGGEKFSHTLWISTDNKEGDLGWLNCKPNIHVDTAHYTLSNTVPLLSKHVQQSASIYTLIQAGLDPQKGFFAKREMIDEFGWRNFGDLYADHETANYQGNDLFVSHYNNQYDPLFGFLRQFIITGDAKWFELADDLAKHIKDIDIYHTTEDKAEYNGGLFWHTDHYVKAYTSSHRSYSKLQESNVYQDHAGGGGPGGQHCYTTGLAYHYLLTGEQTSKQAVLTLTNWISNVYEGTGTCLELLLAIKNRHVLGLKNQLNGQYPFDRGTANYVNALLDSYELTAEPQYLSRVEHIIHNTVHPADDISSRHLSHVETCWFYVVFLQSVCRYLEVKKGAGSFDEKFYYARDALLHYADWMVEHEYPYLDKPEILEYPNDTWTAQDLRKVQVFAAAWYYSPNSHNQAEFLAKAHYFQDYVANKLADSEERFYTRVLALLMQNSGALEYYLQAENPANWAPRQNDWPLSPYMTTGLVAGISQQLFKRVISLSLNKEYQWLRKRLGK